MNLDDRIVIDPEIQHGKPVLRGTRLPISRILGGLAGGMTFEDLHREYDVTDEEIRAAIRYGGLLVEQETTIPSPLSPLSHFEGWEIRKLFIFRRALPQAEGVSATQNRASRIRGHRPRVDLGWRLLR